RSTLVPAARCEVEAGTCINALAAGNRVMSPELFHGSARHSRRPWLRLAWAGHQVSRALSVSGIDSARKPCVAVGAGRASRRSKARRTKRWKQTKWESAFPGNPKIIWDARSRDTVP